MSCPCMPPHCGTMVPTTSPEEQQFLYQLTGGTAVPTLHQGEQRFLQIHQGNSDSYTNSPREQWFLQIHQENSGSYSYTRGTVVPIFTVGTAVPAYSPGNSGSYKFTRGATSPTNSQWNSGSHKRGIVVSKKFTRGTAVPTHNIAHMGNSGSHQLNTTVHVVTASLFKEQRFLYAASDAGPW